MNRLLLALVLILGACVCVTGCTRSSPKAEGDGSPDSTRQAEDKEPKDLLVGKWEGDRDGVPWGMEFVDSSNVILLSRITTSTAEGTVDKGPIRIAGTYKPLDDKAVEITISFGKQKVIKCQIEAKDRLTVTDERGTVVYQRAKDFSAKLTNPAGQGVVPLPSTVQAVDVLRTLGEESDKITCIAFSPDRQWIATGGEDKLIRLWDAKSGEMKQILKGHANEVRGLVFGADGSRLVSGGADCVRFWDVATGKQASSPAPFGSAFGPIGTGGSGKAILVTRFNEVAVYDASGGKIRSIPTPKDVPIEAVTFSPDGRLVAIGHSFGAVSVTSVETGEGVFDFPKSKQASTNVYSVAFSADGKYLARGVQLTIWDTSTWKEVSLPSKVSGRASRPAFSPDGKRLACAEYSGKIMVWDFPKFEQYLFLKGQKAEPSGINFSPDGKMLASVGRDGKVRIWKLPDQK